MSLFDGDKVEALLNDCGLKGSGVPPSTLTVKIGQDVVGCGSLLRTKDGAGWVCCVATERGMRRQGIASAILSRIQMRAALYRMPELWLSTLFWNRSFYEGRGWTFIPIDDVPPIQKMMRHDKKTMLMRWRP